MKMSLPCSVYLIIGFIFYLLLIHYIIAKQCACWTSYYNALNIIIIPACNRNVLAEFDK